MEHLMDAHLSEPREDWTPFDADEHILWLIESGQVPPVNEEAPEVRTFEGFRTQTIAA
jgi:hypothetical protein